MNQATLKDGTKVYCLHKSEAIVLDDHVEGYLQHGISIEDGDVIFDVGANIGIFGVRAFQKHKNLRLFAFEPIPDIHAVLDANAKKFGGKSYHALQCGLSDKPGEMKFTYYPNSPALSTAHPEDWDKNPGELQKAVEGSMRTAPMWYARLVPRFVARWFAKYMRSNAQEVQCALKTVSGVMDEHNLQKIDLLKIDCEGAELMVLEGIEESHWPKIHKAVIEVHDIDGRLEKIRTLLEKNGLTNIVAEKEEGFEETNMINLFAYRSRPNINN